MVKLTFACVVVSILFSVGIYLTRERAEFVAAGGPLASRARVADLGRVGWARDLHGSFHLINQGPNSIVIDHVMQSCDCASAQFPRRAISSLEEFDGAFTWDTRGKMGPAVTNIVLNYTEIVSGTKVPHEAILQIAGDVHPDYYFEPQCLEFLRSESGSRRARLKVTCDTPIKILQATPSHPAFTASIEGDAVVVAYDRHRLDAPSTDLIIRVATDHQTVPTSTLRILVVNSLEAKL
jgi:hypothetical protein